MARGHLNSPVLVESDLNDINIPQTTGYLARSKTPNSSNWEAGHISPNTDSDGHIRTIAPLLIYSESAYETLALSLARQLYQLPRRYTLAEESFGNSSRHVIHNGPIKIPVTAEGLSFVPYPSQPYQSTPYFSATDVLTKSLPLLALQGKVVILGSTATGLYDQISTPVTAIYPAVEIHSNVLRAIIDNSWITTPWWEPTYVTTACLISAALLVILFQARHYKSAAVLIFTLALVPVYLSLSLWSLNLNLRIWPFLLTSLIFAASYPTTLLLGHYFQHRSIQKLFGAYVPPEVVQTILKNPKHSVGIEPEKREMTVLFADVKGFTSIAETMPPEKLANYMNQVLNTMTLAVHRHNGTIDKYMGDELMAFWGAPYLISTMWNMHYVQQQTSS